MYLLKWRWFIVVREKQFSIEQYKAPDEESCVNKKGKKMFSRWKVFDFVFQFLSQPSQKSIEKPPRAVINLTFVDIRRELLTSSVSSMEKDNEYSYKVEWMATKGLQRGGKGQAIDAHRPVLALCEFNFVLTMSDVSFKAKHFSLNILCLCIYVDGAVSEERKAQQ